MTEATPGFEFPTDARDLIEKRLRETTTERQPLRSIRPERQPVVRPIVVEEVAKPAAIPVVQAPPTPTTDPEGISVDLPSRFHYYSFKDLYVRPFRLSHLAKVAKANETNSMQSLVEVVSSVLSTPSGEKDIAFQLTMADFNAVLYWLRLNSFSKRQMRITSLCTNPTHRHQVEVGEKTEQSLTITTVYTESDLKFNYLDSVPDPAVYQIDVPGYGAAALRPETVADVIDFLDHPLWEDPEFQYKARVASVIGLPIRFQDKINLLDDLAPDAAILALQYADLVDSYGVEELVKTNCIGCGASGAVKIAVDARTFLSPEF
jgi:hypothetical protein